MRAIAALVSSVIIMFLFSLLVQTALLPFGFGLKGTEELGLIRTAGLWGLILGVLNVRWAYHQLFSEGA